MLSLADVAKLIERIAIGNAKSSLSVASMVKSFAWVGNFLKTSSAQYAGVFKQVNTSLEYRNSLIRQGTSYLTLATEEITSAAQATAEYGMDVRTAGKEWFDVSKSVSQVAYITDANVGTLAKLANYTQLLNGNFNEVASTILDVVSATSLTGEEATGLANTLSEINYIYGRGEAVTNRQLVTLSRMSDRIKQAGGNARELADAIQSANTKFTGAAAMGFLPGFADSQAGLEMFESRFMSFGKMVMGMSPVIRGTMAEAFGPLFNVSGDALLRHATDVNKNTKAMLGPLKDLKDAWNEAVGSMGDGIGRLFTMGKNIIKIVLLPVIEKFNQWSVNLLDNESVIEEWKNNLLNWFSAIGEWWGKEGPGIITLIKGVGSALLWTVETLADLIQMFPEGTRGAVGFAIAFGGLIMLAAKVTGAMNLMSAGVSGLFKAVSRGIAFLARGIASGFTSIMTGISTGLATFFTSMAGVGPMIALAAPALLAVTIGIGVMTAAIKLVGPVIAEIIIAVSKCGPLIESFASILRAVGDVVVELATSLGGTLIGVLDKLVSGLRVVGDVVVELATSLGNTLIGAITAVGDALSGGITAIFDGFSNVVRSIGESVEKMGNVSMAETALGLGALALAIVGFAGSVVLATPGLLLASKWSTHMSAFALASPQLKIAAESVTLLGKSLKDFPSALSFTFDTASFESVRRLRDATIILDGGRPELERVVSLMERLQVAAEKISEIGRIRLTVSTPQESTERRPVVTAPVVQQQQGESNAEWWERRQRETEAAARKSNDLQAEANEQTRTDNLATQQQAALRTPPNLPWNYMLK